MKYCTMILKTFMNISAPFSLIRNLKLIRIKPTYGSSPIKIVFRLKNRLKTLQHFLKVFNKQKGEIGGYSAEDFALPAISTLQSYLRVLSFPFCCIIRYSYRFNFDERLG